MTKDIYAISACLMGENCKYNGGNNRNEELIQFMKDKNYICVCPEVLGGLTTPRASCERVNDQVMNKVNENVTKQFYDGANIALKQMQLANVNCVISQSRSPSCGKSIIYDGSFTGKLIPGNGVFVEKCLENGYQVYDVNEFLHKFCKRS